MSGQTNAQAITINSGKMVFHYDEDMKKKIDSANEIIDHISDKEKIDLFASFFDDIEANVISGIKTKPIKDESEGYMTRGEKVALSGTTTTMRLPVEHAMDVISSVQENKDAYGVSERDLEVYRQHLDVPQIPVSSTDLSIVNVIQRSRIPLEKVVRVPDTMQFFGKFISGIENNTVNLKPIKMDLNVYGEHKNSSFKALDGLTVTIKRRAPDSYSKFSGHNRYQVTLKSEAMKCTLLELSGFYRKLLKITKLDDVKKRERHIMKVVQVDHQTDLFGLVRNLDPGVISRFYGGTFKSTLELYEKLFISVSHKRVSSGESARINVPSQLTGCSDKFKDIVLCTENHNHVVAVAGSGPVNSLIMKALYKKAKAGDIFHLYDPCFLGSGNIMVSGVSIIYNQKRIEDVELPGDICSFYYDVAIEDSQQQVMTKDYLHCNGLFSIIHEKLPNNIVIYAALGIARNLQNYIINGLWSITGSPEILVSIAAGGKPLYDHLETVMSQKMEYNIKRLSEFKKGNLITTKANVLGFNDHNFERPLLSPKHCYARFLPYSRSSHVSRMIPENSHYFSKKPIIIPAEYEQTYNDYINAVNFTNRKKILDRLPVEVASLIHQKSMGDVKIMSSKIRSTLGIRMGKFKPTLAQAQVLMNHREFVKQGEDGSFHLTVSGQQNMVANDGIVDRFYDMRVVPF